MTKPSAHFTQLDPLRAFAVGAVLLAHFSPTVGHVAPEFGFAGVRLFFVLSGFLITGILLRARARIQGGGSSLNAELRRFWIRRSLRIFPAFYLLLLANLALDISSTREDFWWHATYLSNFLMGLDGAWRDLLTHLWSLAVEEQFYLLWPALMLGALRLSPRNAICAALLIGPISRAALVLAAPANSIAPVLLTPACLDLLAAGALLAWLRHRNGEADPVRRRWRVVGLVLLPLALASTLRVPAGLEALRTVFAPALQAFAFAALIDGAALGFTGFTGRLLSWTPLIWVGQISYGVYLYHNNAHWLGPRILRQLTHYRLAYFPSEALHVAYLTMLALFFASASWYLIERPLVRLKERAAP